MLSPAWGASLCHQLLHFNGGWNETNTDQHWVFEAQWVIHQIFVVISKRLNLHRNIFHWIEIWHLPQKHTKLPNALSHPCIQAYSVPHLLQKKIQDAIWIEIMMHTTGFVTAASMPWRWCQKASWPPSEGTCPIRNTWWSKLYETTMHIAITH